MKIFTLVTLLLSGMLTAHAGTAVCEVSVLGKVVERLESDYSGPFIGEKMALVSILMDGPKLNLCVISKISPDANVACVDGTKRAKLQYNETTFDCTVE